MNDKPNGVSLVLPRRFAQCRLAVCAAAQWGAAAMAACFSLAANAASITWTNTDGGNWSSALNWSPQQVPTSADDVTLATGSYTLTVDIPASAASLTINDGSPTLAGTGPVTVGGSLTWGAGTISTTVSCNGGIVNNPHGLDGGQLINFGTLSWIPYPYTGAGSVISNAAAGVINLTLNGRPFSDNIYGGASTFYNAGQLLASGSGVCTMGDLFINTGLVTVSGGTLEAAGGGTNFGTMTAAASGTVGVAGGTFYFTAASTLSGAGGFIVSGGTANVLCPLNTTGDLTVSGGTANFMENISAAGTWSFSGGVANFGASCSASGQTINITGAAAHFTGPGPWSPSALNLSGGTLAGPSPITVGGPINWSGGTITTMVSCNGGTVNNPEGLEGGQLINFGTLSWTPYPYTGAGSVISNAAAGVINLTLNGRPFSENTYGGASTFYNAGQLLASGSGVCTIGDLFINTGLVTVSGGTLEAAGGGTNFGTMTAAASGMVGVAGGTFYFTAASTLSGAGGFIVSGGTANVLCPLNTTGDLTVSGGTANFMENISAAGTWSFSGGVANFGASCSASGQTINITGATANFTGSGPWSPSALNLSGGTLAGPSPITVSGPLDWSGGSISASVSCNGGTVNNPESLSGGQLINFGTLAWIPYPYTGNGSLISNASSGTINIALNDERPITENRGGASAFCNAGIINVSGASTGAIGDAFTNSGTINLQSGTLGAAAGCYLSSKSVIAFTIAGKTNYSSLAVAGTASLAGVVQASFSGYSPAVGDSYAVVTYPAATGLFNAFNLPPNAVWKVAYAPTVFSLDVIGLSPLASTLTPQSGQNFPFSFLMLGPQGSNYTIEASFDLRSWTALTNFTSSFSSFTFTDSTTYPARFYRAVLNE